MNTLAITHIEDATIESLKNRLLPDKIRLFQVLKKKKKFSRTRILQNLTRQMQKF